MTLKQRAFENIVGKKKMLVTSIFFFSHNVSSSIKERNHYLSSIKVVSAFTLVKAKNLPFSKELKVQETLFMKEKHWYQQFLVFLQSFLGAFISKVLTLPNEKKEIPSASCF